MSDIATTFEEILRRTESLSTPATDEQRQVFWCDVNQRIGLSKQLHGGREVFVRSVALRATSALVERHLKFDSWESSLGGRFEANRIVFPADEYFQPLIALVVEQLLRRIGSNGSVEKAFIAVEPILEMALRRLALGDQTILGLIGELRFLEALLNAAGSDSRKAARIIDCWHGHEWSARDFVLANCSVEVKATRGNRSVHPVHSVMQVDPRRTTDGVPQEQLYLLSIGFEMIASEGEKAARLSLPEQVSSLSRTCSRMSDESQPNSLAQLLLEKIASYGSTPEGGYRHAEMADWPAYQIGWSQTFTRIYDMGDPAIDILRRNDVRSKAHIAADSVQFDLSLPESVSGDLNPQTDIVEFADRIVREL